MVRKAGAEIIDIKSDEADLKLRLVDLIYLGDWAILLRSNAWI